MLNFWIFTSYCSLKPLWSGMWEVAPARTSPILHLPSPPTVHQLSRLALLRVTPLPIHYMTVDKTYGRVIQYGNLQPGPGGSMSCEQEDNAAENITNPTRTLCIKRWMVQCYGHTHIHTHIQGDLNVCAHTTQCTHTGDSNTHTVKACNFIFNLTDNDTEQNFVQFASQKLHQGPKWLDPS